MSVKYFAAYFKCGMIQNFSIHWTKVRNKIDSIIETRLFVTFNNGFGFIVRVSKMVKSARIAPRKIIRLKDWEIITHAAFNKTRPKQTTTESSINNGIRIHNMGNVRSPNDRDNLTSEKFRLSTAARGKFRIFALIERPGNTFGGLSARRVDHKK